MVAYGEINRRVNKTVTQSILIVAALAAIAGPALAQITELDPETEPSLSYLVFVEAGGQGIASINIEKYFSRHIGLRAGGGLLFPVMVNFYFGYEKMFELGVGAAYAPYFLGTFVPKEKSVILSMTIGHRYQPKFGGLTLRYSFTPMLNVTSGKSFPMMGLSFGFAFR